MDESGTEGRVDDQTLHFPDATRVRLHTAVDEVFAEVGGKLDVNLLRQKLNEKIDAVLSTPDEDAVVQGPIATIREGLTKPTRHVEPQLADLHFPDEVYLKLAEIDGAHSLPRERSKLAVLAALLEATELQTPESLSQRTGYALGRMVGIIGSLNNVWLRETPWTISGKSTTGWKIGRF